MIERYASEEMEKIWSVDRKLEHWYNIEIAACEALAHFGVIPPAVLGPIKKKVAIDRQRMEAIEAIVHHDVIAFLTMLSEQIGPDARFMHLGLTSSDILDTTIALQFKESTALLIQKLEELLDTLKKQAFRYKMTPIMGRSHGIHAEPTTFGLKIALWYDELNRNLERLKQTRERLIIGKISGPVGNYSLISPEIEVFVCNSLGLKSAKISSQIIQRDRHAEYLMLLALIGCTLDKMATEIRALQKTETREVEEPFRKGQKGSSAMPHKRNPILCERISGMARLLRGNAQVGYENVPLWHERDISHSSVERIILPDSSHLLYYSMNKMNMIIRDLLVYPDAMKKNIDLSHGLFFSQKIMLELVLTGLTREEAYYLVQRNAMKSWETQVDLRDLVLEDKEIYSRISQEKLKSFFTLDFFFAHVDQIFCKVFGDD